VSEQTKAKEAFEKELHTYVGLEIGPPEVAEDTVNEAMIRHWCQAMGDDNPVYRDADSAATSVHAGLVAPPAMMQAWTMPGIVVAYDLESLDDKQRQLHAFFGEHGYSSVVATDCEQEYTRYLRPGDRVTGRTVIESISEEKATALGIGYFVVTRTVYTDADGVEVGWMTFRVLKFKPNAQPQAAADSGGGMPAAPTRMRPPLAHDNAWWWEGVDEGRLLIQKCGECGTLRHPPRPMCHSCQSLEWDGHESAGNGTIHSYTVMHHPPIPGYEYPLAVALIELDEGTRLVSNIGGIGYDEVKIGMRVTCRIEEVDEGFMLPIFYPVD
jgi:uncharacterized OB-fold protein/acyl dehydratase